MKKDLHPKWYPNAPVIVEGEVVMHVGSTQPEIRVEIWSGTHPFYTGQQRLVDTEGQVDRFMRRLQRRQQIAQEQEKEEEKRDPLKLSVDSMSLSTRYVNALQEAEVTSVGDIMGLIEEGGDDALLALSGIGQMALVEIKRHLRAEGLIE